MSPTRQIKHQLPLRVGKRSRHQILGIGPLVLGCVVIKLCHRLNLDIAKDFTVEDRNFNLAATHVFFQQDFAMQATGGLQRGGQLRLIAHDRDANRAALTRGLDHQRKAEALHIGGPAIDTPARRLDALFVKDAAAAHLIHRQRRRQHRRTGVRNSAALQQSLHAAVFTQRAV